MTAIALAILRCYPRAWRARYAAEVEELIRGRAPTIASLADLVRCAVDAHLRPQLRPVLRVAAPLTESPAAPTIASYGVVTPPLREISRRGFMRRMLGLGAALLSLEFMGGTLAFLWPNITEGLGARYRIGTLRELLERSPDWADGWPYHFVPARVFLVNADAARELASGRQVSVTDPSADQIVALWRKCPHLGCMVPALCPDRHRFQCRCHGSTYNILGEKLVKGPAERGMDRFRVLIEDDVIWIDTSEVIRGRPEGTVTFRDPHPPGEGCDEESAA